MADFKPSRSTHSSKPDSEVARALDMVAVISALYLTAYSLTTGSLTGAVGAALIYGVELAVPATVTARAFAAASRAVKNLFDMPTHTRALATDRSAVVESRPACSPSTPCTPGTPGTRPGSLGTRPRPAGFTSLFPTPMYPPGSAPYLSAVNVTAHVLEMKRRIDQFIPVVPAHRAVCLDEGLAVRSRFLWTPTLGPVFLIELLVSEVEVEWVEMGSSCNLCEVDGI